VSFPKISSNRIPALEKILAATLTGMSVEEFNAEAKKWLETAKHPRWNRPYVELVYEPMLEVLRYLRDNAYKTYIVTGGGQDFVRVYSEKVPRAAGVVLHRPWREPTFVIAITA
jgi:phosphoserine phosphatase